MDIAQMARDYGLKDTYVNKLNLANQYIEDSANQNSNIVNSQLNQQLAQYEQNKKKAEQDAIKEGQSAYVDYAKSINPYGSQAESRFSLGLGNSGLSESSMIGANNTYQNRVTDTVNNRNNIWADIDNKTQQARETANIELSKIQQQKADSMLENLWRILDEQKEEEARQEEQRRWEAEMALQRQQASRRSSGSGSSGSLAVSDSQESDNPTYAQLFAREWANSGYKIKKSIWDKSPARQKMSDEEAKWLEDSMRSRGLLYD